MWQKTQVPFQFLFVSFTGYKSHHNLALKRQNVIILSSSFLLLPHFSCRLALMNCCKLGHRTHFALLLHIGVRKELKKELELELVPSCQT